ncbi:MULTISPECIES: 3-hydroxyacyl-CoA dehydrogenase NAD-binding domain-containing protein [Planococcus]|uniref:L-gulonate 3-dehydrogenase n=1 Tax=Planococcus faecalis TaxID=1598147 RepID=A0ABN4XK96_9BACL|nr:MULTISPECIES: 3-hydroxyacyl-CoA dehydrogenase NAD-binding domain-containing protein [Planococcus]AQU80112.1 3-hydroxybutyryl-CoA dehydrogenase [Planococcus faecalis]MDJ0330510.1 3-hydroxyacyl-CoA dehydrogenase NAD-binding domain-containing protein [Planococcus sp. S3-L1]OHX52559.1 3-hydroxybutyryl-CoA dehydrogenase [Planococcus faecalis]
MEKISILGAGTMGHSIALSAAWAGETVTVYGIDEQDLSNADRGLHNKLKVMTDNKLVTVDQAEEIRQRIQLTTFLEKAILNSTFIIEVVPEVLELKKELYSRLETLISDDVIIASNTSGFKPSLLAEEMRLPARFVVTHFWNPGHLIPLVEVVKGEQTDAKTVERAMAVLKEMNKKAILLHKEIPGFIGNRLQYALFREAQALLDAGVASKEDIDAAVTYSIGRRLPVTGPLMTADMGGLDVFSAISNYLFEELATDQRSGETLSTLVVENKLGDKTGEGFYSWEPDVSAKLNKEREQTLIHFLKKDLKAGASE